MAGWTARGRAVEGAGARFASPDGEALSADGLTVNRDLLLSGAEVTGEVRLPGAHINGRLDCSGARGGGRGGEVCQPRGRGAQRRRADRQPRPASIRG